MDGEKLKLQIGANIAAYRKGAGLTQAGLAEKLNYSDKAVSKWERGESVPDVTTLVQLAEQFGITVNDLLADPQALPEPVGGKAAAKELKRKADRRVIQLLTSTLVWFVALFLFVVVSSFGVANGWLPFCYAIPANAIVLLSLRSAWRNFSWNQALISLIVWGSLLSIHATLWVFFRFDFWKIYLLGIPGQIAIFLWFRMFRPVRPPQIEEESQNG